MKKEMDAVPVSQKWTRVGDWYIEVRGKVRTHSLKGEGVSTRKKCTHNCSLRDGKDIKECVLVGDMHAPHRGSRLTNPFPLTRTSHE